MREKIYIALGVIGFILVMGIVGRMDYEDELLEQQAYCEMRMLFELDASQGVPREHRRGWPNFKDDEYVCKW